MWLYERYIPPALSKAVNAKISMWIYKVKLILPTMVSDVVAGHKIFRVFHSRCHSDATVAFPGSQLKYWNQLSMHVLFQHEIVFIWPSSLNFLFISTNAYCIRNFGSFAYCKVEWRIRGNSNSLNPVQSLTHIILVWLILILSYLMYLDQRTSQMRD